MKLAINGLFADQEAAYAEYAGLIERSDLDTASTIETRAALPITSPGLQRILGLTSDRNCEPNFPVHLVAKDLGYFAATAKGHDAPLPIIAATETVFERGAAGEEHDLDISAIPEVPTGPDPSRSVFRTLARDDPPLSGKPECCASAERPRSRVTLCDVGGAPAGGHERAERAGRRHRDAAAPQSNNTASSVCCIGVSAKSNHPRVGRPHRRRPQ